MPTPTEPNRVRLVLDVVTTNTFGTPAAVIAPLESDVTFSVGALMKHGVVTLSASTVTIYTAGDLGSGVEVYLGLIRVKGQTVTMVTTTSGTSPHSENIIVGLPRTVGTTLSGYQTISVGVGSGTAEVEYWFWRAA